MKIDILFSKNLSYIYYKQSTQKNYDQKNGEH